MAERDLVEEVRQAWVEVLDTQEVATEVNFFDAGGDSILLIVLLERLNALTERELEPPDLFQHSTVRAQADLLAGDGGASEVSEVSAAPDRSALLSRARRAER